jgi:hypothetical protein
MRSNTEFSEIETAGEWFPGGVSIELVADPQSGRLLLLITSNRTLRLARSVEYGGNTYVAPELDAVTLRAVRFPHEISDFGSTKELFFGIRAVFTEYGFSEEVSLVGTYFVIGTWFPDCVPEAPCLLISGPRAEAHLFIQILACLVRHSVQLAHFDSKSLSSLAKIQPTLLIGQESLSVSKLRLLFASNNPNAYVPSKDGLASIYSAKAIFLGMQSDEDSLGNATLRLTLSPLRGKLPVLDSKSEQQIAVKFQSRLLCYRTRNIEKVRESAFDFPWLASGARVLARILGACIIDAPELQADLAPFFQRQQQANQEQNWLDHRCVAIEAGLAICHSERPEPLMYVGEFADGVNAVLKGRGASESLEPKELGAIMRSLGFSPKRSSRGYAFRITDEFRRLIHRLAFEFEVPALLDGKPLCPHCKGILKGEIVTNLPAPESSGPLKG